MHEIRINRSRVVTLGVVALAALGAAGCSSSGPQVEVTLGEFSAVPDPTTVDGGEVEFTADNRGALVHELVVVRAASVGELPTDDDGAVVEDQLPEGALVGEIEDIGSQSSESMTLDLDEGSYVLFCNINEESSDGTTLNHFAEGMHAELEVR
jgi:hypothetical protein